MEKRLMNLEPCAVRTAGEGAHNMMSNAARDCSPGTPAPDDRKAFTKMLSRGYQWADSSHTH